MSGSKDGQTLFHGILPATARGLASKTAVNWHLKVKDIEYNVGLTKNYCITVSMQNISSIHKLIQQILRPHELNDRAIFDQAHPKIIEIPLQNARDSTKTFESENPEIFGRKIFRTPKPKAFTMQTPITIKKPY